MAQAITEFCTLNCDTTKDNDYSRALLAEYHGLTDDDGNNVGNSEAAEQKMNVVGNFTHVTMSMNFWKQKFFLLWLSVDLNEFWTIKHEGKVVYQRPRPDLNL